MMTPAAERATAPAREQLVRVQGPDHPTTDVVFDVDGASLPADNAWPLLQAIEQRLPWLASEALAGIHPLRAVPTAYGVVLLAQRAKLVLRVPAARRDDALMLQGARLDVAGSALAVGAGRPRALRPSATLHAQQVAAEAADEQGFQDDVTRGLRALGVDCGFISGRRRTSIAEGREIAGFALALHGLGPADSLRVQSAGIGGERRLGWGIFVPAKAIVAAEG
jgi:CRISPR-associated protein Cas6